MLRDLVQSIREDAAFYRAGGCSLPWSTAIIGHTLWSLRVLRCHFQGHLCECAADAENGTEDIWCVRCGWSHHVQW